MSSKWTEKLFNLFKMSESQKKVEPLTENGIAGQEKNPRTLLAKKIMKVMKDPHPSSQEETKKPKP